MARIFFVEDNEGLREAATGYLKLDDHEVVEFGRLQGVLEALKVREPDLIILDVMLPDGNGFQLARSIRRDYKIPIIFLTAKTSESDRITGFEVGGDDYVLKPFSSRELNLRVKAVLKRTGKEIAESKVSERLLFKESELVIDANAHLALLDGKEVNLTAAEWKILLFLAANPMIVLSRSRILGECLEYMFEGSERTVDTHVKNIRAKLGDPGWIETVRGFGYRFCGQPLSDP